MSDIVDRATDRCLEQLDDALAQRRREMPRNGKCNWCGEPVAAGVAFCDIDCRDDYSAAEHLRGGR